MLRHHYRLAYLGYLTKSVEEITSTLEHSSQFDSLQSKCIQEHPHRQLRKELILFWYAG